MSARRITLTQLFLQPRVHCVWMHKHAALWFDVPTVLCVEFDSLWQRYCAAGKTSPACFVTDENLVENDALFALFASAVYLDRTVPNFVSVLALDGLHWTM